MNNPTTSQNGAASAQNENQQSSEILSQKIPANSEEFMPNTPPSNEKQVNETEEEIEEKKEVRPTLSNLVVHNSIVVLADELYKRVKKDRDSCVAISGEPGMGKSTLGITAGIIVKRIMSEHNYNNVPFSYHENVIWSRDQLMATIDSTRKNVMVIDEAISLLYKREAVQKTQIELIKILNKCRKLNHTMFFIMPQFTDIDVGIRNARINFWIHVRERGEAYLFKRSDAIGLTDPWYLKELTKIFQSGEFEKLRFIPTFLGMIFFKDLPHDHKKIYRSVADLHAGISDEKTEEVQKIITAKKESYDEGRQEGIVWCAQWLKENNFVKKGCDSAIRLALEMKFSHFKKVAEFLKQREHPYDDKIKTAMQRVTKLEKRVNDPLNLPPSDDPKW